MNENEMEGKDESVNGETEAEIVRIENERMTRRKALRKFGFTAGMAVFSVLSVDDLARIASKKLQETEATKGIGNALAKEFRSAGVAMADPYGYNPPYSPPYNPPYNDPYDPYNPPADPCRPPEGICDCDCIAARDHCYCVESAKAANPECANHGDIWPISACASLNAFIDLCGVQYRADSLNCY